jgi:hypothetical protein
VTRFVKWQRPLYAHVKLNKKLNGSRADAQKMFGFGRWVFGSMYV